MQLLIILLSNHQQPLGERIFVGVLTGIIISIFFWFIQRKDRKKVEQQAELDHQEYTKTIQRNIAYKAESSVVLNMDYSNLYNELKVKCNPSNYMNPYSAEKVEISNSIFSKLDGSKNDVDALIQLRNQAIIKLGLSFSTKALFDRLCEIYNPSNFMGENYDAEKLSAANKIYDQIQQKKDNIIELERIANENGISLFKKPNTIVQTNATSEQNKESQTLDLLGYIVFIIFALSFFLGLGVYGIYLRVHEV